MEKQAADETYGFHVANYAGEAADWNGSERKKNGKVITDAAYVGLMKMLTIFFSNV